MSMPFPCPHCRAVFSTHDALRSHLVTSHSDAHPDHKFRCTTCDEAFMADMKWLKEYEPPAA
jgi:hypothetical protein